VGSLTRENPGVTKGLRFAFAALVVLVIGLVAFVVAFVLLWAAFEPGNANDSTGGEIAAVVVLALAFLASWGLFNLIAGVRRWRGALGTLAVWIGGVALLVANTALRG
jgi:hypothetical protein